MGLYIVKKGDTLTALSATYHGDPNAWRDIYDLNRKTMNNPNKLKIGQVIDIPGYEPEDVEGIPTPRPDPRKGIGPGAGPSYREQAPQYPNREMEAMGKVMPDLTDTPSIELSSQALGEDRRGLDVIKETNRAEVIKRADTIKSLTEQAAIPESASGAGLLKRNPRTNYPSEGNPPEPFRGPAKPDYNVNVGDNLDETVRNVPSGMNEAHFPQASDPYPYPNKWGVDVGTDIENIGAWFADNPVTRKVKDLLVGDNATFGQEVDTKSSSSHLDFENMPGTDKLSTDHRQKISTLVKLFIQQPALLDELLSKIQRGEGEGGGDGATPQS